jgi:catechol 2,3-dioxygenase-like lactoylglutathione lyase family enzyme
MTGIVFFRSENRIATVDFYTERLGFEEWLEQDGGCTILKRDNLLLGFCDGDTTETEGIITVVVDDRDAVDTLFENLQDRAQDEPHENEAFDIYQFFATDPDGRTVEIQTFLHSTPPV